MARRVLFLLCLCVLTAAPIWAQEPVRIGVLTIRSGPIASCGRQMEEGLQFALKERGGSLAGRKVEVFFGDSAGQPAQTRAKTLELVERNRVHVLTGPVAAFEAYAISDYVRQTQTPMVISPAAADDITQRKTNPWFVRATMSGSQVTHPLGEYALIDLEPHEVGVVHPPLVDPAPHVADLTGAELQVLPQDRQSARRLVHQVRRHGRGDHAPAQPRPPHAPRVQAPCVAIDIPAALVEHIRTRLDERAVMLMEAAEV